uniref:ISXO2-like transposase domain-containing protein n=1 Tax=Meloidogyne enterolobii TaxID=390850 RepID=A0A6V7W8U8_MELEN|nr:unnamed protein product [Meloidogyne enterolobii]
MTSSATVADWFNYCREVTCVYLDGLYENDGPIGGPGHIIECDEMKLEKREYERGRVVEGSWILGMIDIETNELRLEICPDNKRDKDTLLSLITKHVRPDSTIFTDFWRGYADLFANGFEHYCVNHQLHFVNPETQANTNKIESQWRPIRKRLARGGVHKEKLADHLCEFLWRRDAKRHEKDTFNHLITIIAKQFNFS